jgi:hypothetical protein
MSPSDLRMGSVADAAFGARHAPSVSVRDYGSLMTELPRRDVANSRFIGGAHVVGGHRALIDRPLVI